MGEPAWMNPRAQLTSTQLAALDSHDWPPASFGQSTCNRCGWTVSLTDIDEVPPCPEAP